MTRANATAERRRLIAYLKRGGAVTRCEVDMGERAIRFWMGSAVAGRRFSADLGDKLVERGCKIGGVRHALRWVPGSLSTYVLERRTPE